MSQGSLRGADIRDHSRLGLVGAPVLPIDIPLASYFGGRDDEDGADPELHLPRGAVHLISEALDVVEGVDDENLVSGHLALHGSEEGAPSRFL